MYDVVVKRWRSLSHLLMSSCWDIVRKTNKQTNGGKNPTPARLLSARVMITMIIIHAPLPHHYAGVCWLPPNVTSMVLHESPSVTRRMNNVNNILTVCRGWLRRQTHKSWKITVAHCSSSIRRVAELLPWTGRRGVERSTRDVAAARDRNRKLPVRLGRRCTNDSRHATACDSGRFPAAIDRRRRRASTTNGRDTPLTSVVWRRMRVYRMTTADVQFPADASVVLRPRVPSVRRTHARTQLQRLRTRWMAEVGSIQRHTAPASVRSIDWLTVSRRALPPS